MTDSRSYASPRPRKSHKTDSIPSYKPYIPDFQPVDSPLQSDHSDLDLPTQHDSRSLRSIKSARRLSRPPTAAGGPLSSHPTDSEGSTATSRPSPSPYSPSRFYKANAVMSSDSTRDPSGSFVAPVSPSSARDAPGRRPSGVRRLFSLSSLRQSFSSSRTSLSLFRPGSSYGSRLDLEARPTTPSGMSTTASVSQPAPMHSSREGAALRRKRSSGWFKRKSGFFGVNENGELDVLDDDSQDTREPKRYRETRQLPMLPELSTLGGGDLDGGSLGWDEQQFRR